MKNKVNSNSYASRRENPLAGLIRILFGTLCFLFGLGLFLYPTVSTKYIEVHTKKYIEEFEKENKGKNKEKDDRYLDCVAYNEENFLNGQADFRDAWDVTQSPINMKAFKDGKFGYIKIPSMKVKLPLYIGATNKNMSLGAVVLGGTSLPIGGENTNSVIAGHRGYNGAPFFREIEKMKLGDKVYIRNAWETLTYKAVKIDVIKPDDSDKVKIQEGKDMITLMTCHPYRSHGKMRYVVYCVRDGSDETMEPSETTIVSSEPDIQMEDTLRMCVGLLMILMVIVTILRNRKKKK